jgi:hypothetical protein
MKLGRTKRFWRQGGWVAIVEIVEAAWIYISEWWAGASLGDLFVAGYAVYSVRNNQIASHKARQFAASQAQTIESRMQMVRQAISSWRVIYGTVRVSGAITFFHTTNNNNTLHILLTLAGHEIAGIDDIYFNDVYIPLAEDGSVISGRWAGYAIIKKGLGSTAGDAALNALMIASTGGKWTANHKQTGHAKLYIQITFNRDLMAEGLPNISCVVRGKKVYDPRTTLTVWSDNAALCIRDYLTDTKRGFGAIAAEINDTSFAAAANICDERVTFAGRSDTFMQISWSPIAPITVGSGGGAGAFLTNIIYQHRVTFIKGSTESAAGPASTGVCFIDRDGAGYSSNVAYGSFDVGNVAIGPEGTTARKIYRDEYSNEGSVIFLRTVLVGTIANNTATTFIDESAGTVVSPPATSTLEQGDQISLVTGMYTQTGDAFTVSTTGTLPAPLAAATTYYWIRLSPTVGQLATTYANAMAGTAIDLTTIGTGTHTLTVSSEPRYRCNGTFETSQQKADVLRSLLSSCGGTAPYIGGTFSLNTAAWRTPTATLTADDLDGTINVVTRLSRRDVWNGVKGIFSNPADLWQPTDFPAITNATYLSQDGGERLWRDIDLPFTTSYATAQRLAKIDLEQVRQQISTVWPCKLSALVHQVGDVVRLTYPRFGWSAKEFEIMDLKLVSRQGNEGVMRIGVDLALRETAASVYDWNNGEETIVDPAPDTTLPSATVVEALTGLLLESGTSQLYLRLDGTVFSRLKVSWTAAVGGYIQQGGNVEIQYRTSNTTIWNAAEMVSGTETYTYILEVQDGTNYDVRARFRNSIGVAGAWSTVFGHRVIGKTAPPENVTGFTAGQNGNVVVLKWDQVSDIDLAGYEIRYIAVGGSNWDAAIALTKVTRGTQVTSAALPPGSWTLLMAARDTSGNYSTGKTPYDIDVTNAFDIIYQLEQAPDWLGTKTNFVEHWTGVLVPDSQDAASIDTWDTFDIFVPNPYATCTYEAPEKDIGFIDTVRLWASYAAALGPGEIVGFPNPTLQVDYHSGAGYDGFEAWTIGDVTGRYFKEKLVLNTADGVAYISSFKPTLDVTAHTEQAIGVVIGAGGTAITFTNRFHYTPNIQLTVQGGSGLTPSFTGQSATGFTAHVYDSTGTEVGGTINWTATGD